MANFVSLLRTLLGFVAVGLLFFPAAWVYWLAFVLTITVIAMDGLDGYVARKLNESSPLGAVIDILGDRVVETTYWLGFLALGWVPLWIPLVVVVRGIVVDGLRAMAFAEGFTAFGASSMMQSSIGIFLVSSRASRWLYAACKAIAFALLIVAHITLPPAWHVATVVMATISVYITVFFCVVRGLPVLFEARRFFTPSDR